MAETNTMFKLVILTPEKNFYEKDVDQVTMRSTEGDIGVLKGHIPYTVPLAPGPCKIEIDGKEYVGITHGGFAEIQPDHVTILVDAAEWPDEIDVDRAKRRMKEAQDMLADPHADQVKIASAKSMVMRQTARLELTGSEDN